VKCIQLGFCDLQPDEYRAVIAFARAAGFDFYINAKGFARVSAPLGVLAIRELRAGRQRQKGSATKQLTIEVSNPQVVRGIAESMHLKIVSDPDAAHFTVELPGNLSAFIVDSRGPKPAEIEGTLNGAGRRFAVVVSRFNAFITERLLQGTLDGLTRLGANVNDTDLVRVPGAFEIPLAARKLAETKNYDAIICIGCLLRGDTAHYDVIVNEVTRGIGQSAQETGVPHAFGVLTCENLEQAIDRAGLKMGNKGFEAALAAVEMASLKEAISNQHSAVSKKQIPFDKLRASSASRPASRQNDKLKGRPTAAKTKRK